jgi:hypothetical protein
VELSLDYAALIATLDQPLHPEVLGAALLDTLGDRYKTGHGECALYQFKQFGADYLFDLASSAGLLQEDRTVAAWALTPGEVGQRDTGYQRGFPMAAGADGAAVDRGHLIPHLSGGEFGPNIFRQDRHLNRGWSEQGKRYRALEREAAGTPGTFFFGHLMYGDDTAHPIQLEIGLLRGGTLHVEKFDNRPGNG